MNKPKSPDTVVLDASAFVDMLVNPTLGKLVQHRISGCEIFVPSHFSAEVVSALGRMCRAHMLTDHEVEKYLDILTAAHFTQTDNTLLIPAAWALRHQFALKDALYIALAFTINAPLITTDKKLHEVAEVIQK